MSNIKLFENQQVRTVWDAENEKWYVSIFDVISILTEQSDYQGGRNYWKVLKFRLIKEGNETVTNCNQLKMVAPDGKMRLTDEGKRLITHLVACLWRVTTIIRHLAYTLGWKPFNR